MERDEMIVTADSAEDMLRGKWRTMAGLIRCKDCKYMTEHYDVDGNVPYWTCSQWDSGTDYDGYCHYGERREDDEIQHP